MYYELIAVAVGGGIGATLRYLIGVATASLFPAGVPFYPFPLSTFLANALGCFLMGFLSVFFAGDLSPSSATWKTFATTGILGGFTTLSTFGLETMTLFDNGTYGMGVANVAVTLTACLVGIVLGRMCARAVLPAA